VWHTITTGKILGKQRRNCHQAQDSGLSPKRGGEKINEK